MPRLCSTTRIERRQNRLDSIDPALRRPGRFDREFLFTLPSKACAWAIRKWPTARRRHAARFCASRPSTGHPSRTSTFSTKLQTGARSKAVTPHDRRNCSCVGFCGADLKALCTEAVLCSLRRQHPQIYFASEKVGVDVHQLRVSAEDFATALRAITPASQRVKQSCGRPLPAETQPLLGMDLDRALEAVAKLIPHAFANRHEIARSLLDACVQLCETLSRSTVQR